MGDFHIETAQDFDDTTLIRILFFHVDGRVSLTMFVQKRKRRKFIA